MKRWWWIVLLFLLMSLSVQAVELESYVVDKLRQDYTLDSTTYEIEVISNALQTISAEPDDISYRPLTQTEPLGLYTVLVEVTRLGNIVERGQMRFRISRFANVLVATDRISRHEKLSETKFAIERRDVTTLREQAVASLDEVEDYRTTRHLRKGQVVTTGAVEPRPDIEVGREVTIIYADGLCEITVPGRMMETGWIGDWVKVKNNTSGKIVTAKVVDGLSVAVNP